jgi:ribosomal protein S15P/S13E
VYKHQELLKKLAAKIRAGKHYSENKKDIKTILLLTTYIEMLQEYTLQEEDADSVNFLTPVQMQNLALKINYLTGLRYNYNFILELNL